MITRLLAHVVGRPWAVTPDIAELVSDVLMRRALDVRLTAADLEARIGRPRGAAPVRRADSAGPWRASTDPERGMVAVLPVYGLLAHRARLVRDVSSPASTSTELLGAQLRAWMADPRVSAVVLDVDSPGGSVEGVPELAAEIRRLRGAEKPIIAVANSLAGSAAYYLASQADELVVIPSGRVGSIGVVALHEDVSRRLDAEGRRVTLVWAGQHKVEGNPFEPLGEQAQAALQAQVDAYYAMFLSDVAQGRGVPVARVRQGFGQGRLVLAREAVANGMADRVATLEQVLEELAASDHGAARDRSARPLGSATAHPIGAGVPEDLRRRQFRLQRLGGPSAPASDHRGRPGLGTVRSDASARPGETTASEADVDQRWRRARLRRIAAEV